MARGKKKQCRTSNYRDKTLGLGGTYPINFGIYIICGLLKVAFQLIEGILKVTIALLCFSHFQGEAL